MSIATGVVHVILFALAVQAMVAATLSTDTTSVSWTSENMAGALASFVSINTPSSPLLLKTSFSAPFTLVDVVAGVATGPIGVIIVCIALAILLLIAGSKNSSGGSSNCKCDDISCPSLACNCNCCECATSTSHGGGSFWYGPPWWWWWWSQPTYYSHGSAYYSRRGGAAPAPTVIVVGSPLLQQGLPQQQGQLLGPTPAPSAPPRAEYNPSLAKVTQDDSKGLTTVGAGEEDPVAPASAAFDAIPSMPAKSLDDSYQRQPAPVSTWGESPPSFSSAGSSAAVPQPELLGGHPPYEAYDNPHKWKQCGALTCVQLILACVVIGLTVSSWKTFDCIVLAST